MSSASIIAGRTPSVRTGAKGHVAKGTVLCFMWSAHRQAARVPAAKIDAPASGSVLHFPNQPRSQSRGPGRPRTERPCRPGTRIVPKGPPSPRSCAPSATVAPVPTTHCPLPARDHGPKEQPFPAPNTPAQGHAPARCPIRERHAAIVAQMPPTAAPTVSVPIPSKETTPP